MIERAHFAIVERVVDSVHIWATSSTDVSQFVDLARAWFSSQPEQLSLVSDATNSDELKAFYEQVRVWRKSGIAIPDPYTIEYKPPSIDVTSTDPQRRRGGRKKGLESDHYSTVAAVARRSITTYIVASDDERSDTPTGVVVPHVEGDVVIDVEMRSDRPAPDHVAIRRVASQLGGVDEDVLDVLVGNAINNGPDHDGLYEVEIDAILAARGRGQKRKREGGKTYSAGMRNEARQDVIESIDALGNLYIAADQPKRRRGKLVRDFDRVFFVHRKTFLNADGSGDLIAIAYRFGAWFDAWRRHRVLAPRHILELDANRNAQEKRLGRYFVHLGDQADHTGRLYRRVADIFADLRRPMEDAQDNPSRVKHRLESQLQALVSSGVILAWAYDPEPKLPARGWMQDWLGASLVVTLPARSLPR